MEGRLAREGLRLEGLPFEQAVEEGDVTGRISGRTSPTSVGR